MQFEKLGSSVFGSNEIHPRLKAFKERIKGASRKMSISTRLGGQTTDFCFPHRPRLWFVKVDVKACFDTIDQGKVLEIMKNLISEVSPRLYKYLSRR